MHSQGEGKLQSFSLCSGKFMNKYVNANSSHLRDRFVRGCPVLKLNCLLKQLSHLAVYLAELVSRNDLYSVCNLNM